MAADLRVDLPRVGRKAALMKESLHMDDSFSTRNDPPEIVEPLSFAEAASFIGTEMNLWWIGRGRQRRKLSFVVTISDLEPSYGGRWDATIRPVNDTAGAGSCKVTLHDPKRGGFNHLQPISE